MSDTLTITAPVPTIHQAMANVMRSIGAVDKGGWNEQQKYAFRGIDQFMTAVHPAMTEHGVFVLPEVVGNEFVTRETRNGGVSTHRVLTVKYTFMGPAGDSVSCTTVGESADTYDKASNKCLAAAFKYALMQVFCIPLESEKDADAQSPDMGQVHSGPTMASREQTKQFTALSDAAGMDRAAKKAYVKEHAGREFWKDVTEDEAADLIKQLQADAELTLTTNNAGGPMAYPTDAEPFDVSGDASTREGEGDVGGDGPPTEGVDRAAPVGATSPDAPSRDDQGRPVPPTRGAKP